MYHVKLCQQYALLVYIYNKFVFKKKSNKVLRRTAKATACNIRFSFGIESIVNFAELRSRMFQWENLNHYLLEVTAGFIYQ